MLYHLTNNKDFTIDNTYNNKDQEWGKGLYLTDNNNIENWNNSLRIRNFIVTLDDSNIKLFDMNSCELDVYDMQNEMVENMTCDVEEYINQFLPTGNTFNNDPFELASIQAYVIYKGFDGIICSKDRIEGQQYIIINTSNLKINNINKLIA